MRKLQRHSSDCSKLHKPLWEPEATWKDKLVNRRQLNSYRREGPTGAPQRQNGWIQSYGLKPRVGMGLPYPWNVVGNNSQFCWRPWLIGLEWNSAVLQPGQETWATNDTPEPRQDSWDIAGKQTNKLQQTNLLNRWAHAKRERQRTKLHSKWACKQNYPSEK